MTKRINTEKAPAAIGPYSQGVAAKFPVRFRPAAD